MDLPEWESNWRGDVVIVPKRSCEGAGYALKNGELGIPFGKPQIHRRLPHNGNSHTTRQGGTSTHKPQPAAGTKHGRQGEKSTLVTEFPHSAKMASSTSSAFDPGSFADDSRALITRSRTTCGGSNEQRHRLFRSPGPAKQAMYQALHVPTLPVVRRLNQS